MSTLATEFKAKELKKSREPDKYQKARENFWDYEKMINPKFFKETRPHLKDIAQKLQAAYERRIYKYNLDDPEWKIAESVEEVAKLRKENPDLVVCRRFMLNMPPRHGKSYSVSLFTDWALGKNNENRVIAVSYNEILAGRFSSTVRDGIDATKIDDSINIFSDVFPATKIKAGDASKQIWSLEGQFFNYLGTGFGGTITGVGCNIGIIDDPIKNDKEAFNDRILSEQWSWYTDTFLSRVEEDGLYIIIMTRWSKKDLCGRLLDSSEGKEWYELRQQACQDEVNRIMLCPELFSFQSYVKKKALTSKPIMEANYQQNPIDVKGALYTNFKTYETVPVDGNGKPLFERIKAYVDTADTGNDFLCSIVYGEYNMEAYVLDIIYTQDPMEVTEEEVAASFYFNKVNDADIESNNGGRGFARAVEKKLKEKYHSNQTIINWFHQSENKIARIRAAATWVMNHIYYPVIWMDRWPDYYIAMKTYKSKGDNDHDDGPDATTGVAEKTGYETDNWMY